MAAAPRRHRQRVAVHRADVRLLRRAGDLPGHQRVRQVADAGAAAAAVPGRRPAAGRVQGLRHGQPAAAHAGRLQRRPEPDRLRVDRAAPGGRRRRGVPDLRARREGVQDLAGDHRLVAVHHPGPRRPRPPAGGPRADPARPGAPARGHRRRLRAGGRRVPGEDRRDGVRRARRPVRRPAAPPADAAQPRRRPEGAGGAAGADPVRRAAAAGPDDGRAAGDLVRRPGVHPGEHHPAVVGGRRARHVPQDLLRLRVRRPAHVLRAAAHGRGGGAQAGPRVHEAGGEPGADAGRARRGGERADGAGDR